MKKKNIMTKKILTKEEFQNNLKEFGEQMVADDNLQKKALEVLIKADEYNWVHQTTWLGEPILNIPHDMFALQEIIYKTKPEYIIEVGVCWGGSLLFYSTLMEILGGKKIIGIDIFVPDDLVERITSNTRLSKKIEWIIGSSIEEEKINKVKNILGKSKNVMVLLDSDHCHDHVLKELEIYSQFVGKGSYLICGDTIIDQLPKQKHRDREWGPDNNPKTALDEFMKQNDRFVNDTQIENKLLFTCNPNGYLKAIKD